MEISLEVQESSIGCTIEHVSIIRPERAPDEREGASHLLVSLNDLGMSRTRCKVL